MKGASLPSGRNLMAREALNSTPRLVADVVHGLTDRPILWPSSDSPPVHHVNPLDTIIIIIIITSIHFSSAPTVTLDQLGSRRLVKGSTIETRVVSS